MQSATQDVLSFSGTAQRRCKRSWGNAFVVHEFSSCVVRPRIGQPCRRSYVAASVQSAFNVAVKRIHTGASATKVTQCGKFANQVNLVRPTFASRFLAPLFCSVKGSLLQAAGQTLADPVNVGYSASGAPATQWERSVMFYVWTTGLSQKQPKLLCAIAFNDNCRNGH